MQSIEVRRVANLWLVLVHAIITDCVLSFFFNKCPLILGRCSNTPVPYTRQREPLALPTGYSSANSFALEMCYLLIVSSCAL